MSTEARPFLKWAGGKGQLLSQLSEHLPDVVKAEDAQTDCFMCREEANERLPFLEDE